jgi:hypothetical protein
MLTARDALREENRLDTLIIGIASNDTKALERKAKQGEAVLAKLLEARDTLRTERALSSLVVEIDHASASIRALPNFKPVQTAHDELAEVREVHDSLARLVDAAVKAVDWVERRRGAIKRAQTDFHNATHGKECPLCQRLFP